MFVTLRYISESEIQVYLLLCLSTTYATDTITKAAIATSITVNLILGTGTPEGMVIGAGLTEGVDVVGAANSTAFFSPPIAKSDNAGASAEK